MKPYREFCEHYRLNSASADAKEQYQAYCDNLAALISLASRPPKTTDNESGSK